MIVYRLGDIMDAIYSSVALRDRQREVKDAAREHVVRITENGAGAYVFCSEAVYERELRRAAEEAVYAERMAVAVREGREDVAAGRIVVGAEAAMERIRARTQRG